MRPGTALHLLTLTFTLTLSAADPALSPADLQFFETKIRPVLAENCYKCHSHQADRIKGRLLLDSRDAVLAGGVSGPALVPGHPDDSLLIQAIRYTDEDLKMPPQEHGGKLTEPQIADLTEWVRRGARDPRIPALGASGKAYGGVGRAHWAFQPVQPPAVPAVNDPAWGRSPVDNFVLAKLEAAGLHPNPPADKRTLIRRVTFDLTGLPPTEPEIQRFLADESADAFAKVVDLLLASPAYGEHWARYWLDVARYSDTKGDAPRRNDPRYPHAWTYRDYVIDAFNTDKPYNRFILEQLAADRLVVEQENKAKAQKQEPPADRTVLAALGFLTLGNQFDGRRDDVIADQIDVTTKAFLGLTVACARCHDHKFDPIPTKDYYSLYGVFANTVEPPRVTDQPTLLRKIPQTPDLLDYMAKSDALEKKEAALQAQFLEFRRAREKDPAKRRELVRAQGLLQRQIGDLEIEHPGAPARANVVVDVPRARDYTVLVRGEPQHKGEPVPRRFLEALSPDPQQRAEWHKGSGRVELARAIADPANPLTARVLVNRLWQQHFGAGFVATPDDLGNMSSPPTHPELLDWLAARFVASGWSIKQLQRTIVLSSTYQQSGTANPAATAVDAGNRLLGRANLRRLGFEEVYDSLLAIAGTLDRTVGGKSIMPSSDSFGTRRSLYTYIDRRNPPELLTQFDFPNPDTPSGKRYETTVPQQALFLMNSPLVVETARQLTHRPEFAALTSDRDRVTSLYLAIFQRPPSAQEADLGLTYVRANPAGLALEVSEPPALKTARAKAQEQRRARQAANNPNAKYAADQRPVGSSITPAGPEDAWTKLAHALFQTNEAMFVN
ncbi:MAG: PSD1 and planctomycete cytochrome C domain-containing protein [Lacunisphaera sp.]|nr:PSD1 and planctomycete cytochrome C domain-containing protein [Lacunisphaera sp.]